MVPASMACTCHKSVLGSQLEQLTGLQKVPPASCWILNDSLWGRRCHLEQLGGLQCEGLQQGLLLWHMRTMQLHEPGPKT